MKKQSLLALILILSFTAPVWGQRGVAPPPPREFPTRPPEAQQEQRRQTDPQQEDVVRITTNLVQVDAVVTDRDRKPVTDLTAEDFEILEDGKPQQITNFSFVSTERAATTREVTASSATPATKAAPTVPPAPLRP
jgi:hypothetical protein